MQHLLLSLITIIPALGVDAGTCPGSYDHFVGVYAYEATSYWPEYEITQTGDTFTLQMPDSKDWKLILKASNNALVGKHDGGEEFSITYYPSKKLYALDAFTQMATQDGTKTVPVQKFMVKVFPNPGEKLEEQYGVRAADLVTKVRQSERWIHEADSIQIFANDKWIKTPEGIAHSRKELQDQFPEMQISRKRFWSLSPEVTGRLEIAFDHNRFRSFKQLEGYEETMQLWDGQQYTYYAKGYSHKQERYQIEPELGNRGNFLLTDFMWPRSQLHEFWWSDVGENDPTREDWYGRAEDYTLTGKQDYRGTPCYILECKPKEFRRVRRWFVGVEDRLLHGNLVYEEGQKMREYWTIDYREVQPNWFFPMKQGYYLSHRGKKLEYVASGWRELDTEKIVVNEKLPDDWFKLEITEGARVVDKRFGGYVTYEYKKDMSEEEWEKTRQKARKRAERDSAAKEALDARIGQVALEFPKECKWLNTDPLTWQSLRGKAVVLQFWGHWCGPCKNYMRMIKAQKPDDSVIVIGVHTPETDMKAIKEVMSKYHADGPVCVDLPPEQSRQSWGRISSWFAVKGIPYWFVVGPDGKVAGHARDPGTAFVLASKARQEVK